MTKRPQKRRRVSTVSNTTSGTESSCTAVCLSPSKADVASPSEDLGSLSCNSCHRSLALRPARGSSQNNIVICPRCRASSCSICARTCTSLPPSLPPTPALSYSPSPPGTPSSECRPLPVDLEQTPRARAPVQSVIDHNESSRRRKRKEDYDDDETVIGAEDLINDKVSYTVLPGCGRKVCRNCCIENLQCGTTTCYDCYGLPPSDHNATDSYPLSNPSMTSLALSHST